MKTESLFQFLEELLSVSAFPDFPGAFNGLQVEGPAELNHLAVAVDASQATIDGAAASGADLLLVHHGLLWGDVRPITGRTFRKLSSLIESRIGLYSVHLPLDAHAEVGNAAVLARELGVEVAEPFGAFEDEHIGWSGTFSTSRDGLRDRIAEVVGRGVHLIPGGPEEIHRVAVATGSGGSFISEAADAGMDALVTGEGKHHDFVEATELGLNVYYAGHYATETWGVRALAEAIEDRFSLPWTFIDEPSGL